MIDERPTASFVGRDAELGALRGRLERVKAAAGQLILIGGEPGIGKTRLADEVAATARGDGFMVLWGRAWEDAGAPAYWPWVQVLRGCAHDLGVDDVASWAGAGATDLARLLPELGRQSPQTIRSAAQDADAARFQLFDSVATFLVKAAETRPMLVLLDDLQASDTPSLLLLRFLASQLAQTRIGVIGTYRTIDLAPAHPLWATLAELEREPVTTRMNLEGLDAPTVRELVAILRGRAPRGHLAAAIARQTGGNPLFVVEALRFLAEQGAEPDLDAARSLPVVVPSGIRDLIMRRIERLGTTTVEALVHASALGPEFAVDVLGAVTAMDAAVLGDAIDDLVRAGILVHVAGATGRQRFSHDLVRAALYESLAPRRRADLHLRIAQVIERGAGGRANSAELARHFLAAALGAGPDGGAALANRASEHAVRAGEQALRSLGYEEAARLYRTALDALEVAGEPAAADRVAIQLALGDAQARAGALDDARATFLEAAAVARSADLGTQLAQAALGYGGRFPWARAGNDRDLIPLLEEATLSGPGEGPLRVRLLGRLACALRGVPGQRDRSAALSNEAVEVARTLNDSRALSYALTCRYWAIWWPENPEERLSIAEEALAIARSSGDAERIIDAHQMRYQTLVDLGQMDEARMENDTVTYLARELRQPAQLWLAAGARVLLALMSGEFGLAQRLMGAEVTHDSPSNPARDDLSAARMHRFLLSRDEGHIGDVEDEVRQSATEFPWYPLHRAALACLLADLGRTAESRTVFDELAVRDFTGIDRDSEWLLGIALASEACATLGDADRARSLYEQLEGFAGRHAVGHAEGSLGAVDRCLGLLAETMGDTEVAVRHLEQAISVNQAMGARPWTAHSQADLARILRVRDRALDRERARALETAALATARSIGMVALERALEALPAEAGSTSRGPAARVGTFRREGEYWTVALGEEALRVRDGKGMRYLRQLLAEPGSEIHVMDLVRSATGGLATASGGAKVDLPGGGFSPAFSGAGEVLDVSAREAYRRRLQELEAELAEAVDWNDTERAGRLQAERGALIEQLAEAVGLGGRPRAASSVTERARISVSKAVHGAIRRIEANAPEIGRHLALAIHTGLFCSYTPDPGLSLSWVTAP